MKSAIIGYGIVGKATHHSVLNNSQAVDVFDLDNILDFDKKQYDLVFVCVPTANHQDLISLTVLVKKILQQNSYTAVCVRSSVPVGYVSQGFSAEADRVVYFPEFLRERRWREDSEIAPWVLGGTVGSMRLLIELANDKKIITLSAAEAEILKMMVNAYSALRVVFANHIYTVSQSIKADYDKIEHAYNLVEHNDQTYLQVNDHLRGFGGKCLPKDLQFLIETFEDLNLPQTLLTSAQRDNQLWPVTVRKDT